jgi:hypothetical protein
VDKIKDLTFLQADCIRRTMTEWHHMDTYDLVYTELPNGEYYCIRRKYSTLTDDETFLTKSELLSLTRLEYLRHTKICVDFITEEDVLTRMQDIYRKYWIHPETSTIFRLCEFRNPVKGIDAVGKLEVISHETNSAMDVFTNSLMFDMIWESDTFFKSLEEAEREKANER